MEAIVRRTLERELWRRLEHIGQPEDAWEYGQRDELLELRQIVASFPPYLHQEWIAWEDLIEALKKRLICYRYTNTHGEQGRREALVEVLECLDGGFTVEELEQPDREELEEAKEEEHRTETVAEQKKQVWMNGELQCASEGINRWLRKRGITR